MCYAEAPSHLVAPEAHLSCGGAGELSTGTSASPSWGRGSSTGSTKPTERLHNWAFFGSESKISDQECTKSLHSATFA